MQKNGKNCFTIAALIIIGGCALTFSENLILPANYTGPIAETPEYKVGEKWAFANLTKNKEFSHEIIEVSDDRIKTLTEGDTDSCGDLQGIVERDKNFTAINALKNYGIPKCFLNWRYLNFPLWLGKKWKFTADGPRHDNNINFISVESYENLKVGTYTFKAFKIRQRQTRSGASNIAQRYYWYAPEVRRIVKWDKGEFSKGEVVLKSYNIKSIEKKGGAKPSEKIQDVPVTPDKSEKSGSDIKTKKCGKEEKDKVVEKQQLDRQIEIEKLRIEKIKAWCTLLAVIVPLFVASITVWVA
ncbi:MAG: hypothetical protein GY749_05110 [Desulfobacteraceae bacterium]|nr:hypothetical protein [Desulfobacteraceae bacterium]